MFQSFIIEVLKIVHFHALRRPADMPSPLQKSFTIELPCKSIRYEGASYETTALDSI